MAKYRKAIDLWKGNIFEQLISGKLYLQSGQWVKCGQNDPQMSRYVGVAGRSIRVAHGANNKQVINRYKAMNHYYQLEYAK